MQSAPSLTKRKVDSRVGSLNIVLKPDLHRRRVVAPGSGPLQRTAVLGVCLCLVRDGLPVQALAAEGLGPAGDARLISVTRYRFLDGMGDVGVRDFADHAAALAWASGSFLDGGTF